MRLDSAPAPTTGGGIGTEEVAVSGPQWLFTLGAATLIGVALTAAIAWWVLWS